MKTKSWLIGLLVLALVLIWVIGLAARSDEHFIYTMGTGT